MILYSQELPQELISNILRYIHDQTDVAVLTSDGAASIIKAVLVNFRARDVANHR